MENRKKDHINLALKSSSQTVQKDHRFFYEPVLHSFPNKPPAPFTLAGKLMQYPFWISSMTGGTKMARIINNNLAQLSNEFKLGMGLGSCRIILDNEKHLPDFDMRPVIGESQPLFANMGIAQLEQMTKQDRINELHDLVALLKADGMIIHINPMHEFFQPEGDHLEYSPLETLENYLKTTTYPVIAKEVGQGMGPQSLEKLLKMPLEAIEFGAFGGTNFAKVEMERDPNAKNALFEPLSLIGHTALEMTQMANEIKTNHKESLKTHKLIISGGVKNFLDGYYLTTLSKMPAAFGMASAFLKYATGDYTTLKAFTRDQIKGYVMAQTYLTVNK